VPLSVVPLGVGVNKDASSMYYTPQFELWYRQGLVPLGVDMNKYNHPYATCLTNPLCFMVLRLVIRPVLAQADHS
jgi:hypothetical protein